MTRSVAGSTSGLDRRRVGGQQVAQAVHALGAVEHDEVGDPGGLHRRAGPVQERRDGDQQLRPGVLQLEGDLVGGVEGVDRAHHAAGRGDAVEDHREPDGVRGEDRDDVALAQPAGVQRGGEAVDVGDQLGVRDRLPGQPVDQRRGVPQLARARQDVGRDGGVGDLDVGEAAGVRHGWSSSGLDGVTPVSHPPWSPPQRAYRPVGLSAARAPTACTGTAPWSSRGSRR